MVDDPAYLVLIETGSLGVGREIGTFDDHVHASRIRQWRTRVNKIEATPTERSSSACCAI
jgi:hypothetical protein